MPQTTKSGGCLAKFNCLVLRLIKRTFPWTLLEKAPGHNPTQIYSFRHDFKKPAASFQLLQQTPMMQKTHPDGRSRLHAVTTKRSQGMVNTYNSNGAEQIANVTGASQLTSDSPQVR